MGVVTHDLDGIAAVVGGGIAGLLAARVLAEVYDQVILVDRDALTDGQEVRPGVPQGRHAHALLTRGARVMEQLLPGLESDLLAHGAIPGDLQRDFRWYNDGRPLARARSGLSCLLASRPLLESVIRSAVLAEPRIKVLTARVRGLRFDAAERKVTGVHLGEDSTIAAGLVVDASGRTSRVSEWLSHAGFAPSQEERIHTDVQYVSRRYRRSPGDLDGDLAAVISPTPRYPRGGVALAQEEDRWQVTLFGQSGARPPVDHQGFTAYAASLPLPDVHTLVEGAEPLDDPVAFRLPASVRRRYERLRRFPAGLLVIGDAVCSFNPIYGQGMTIAALEALSLRAYLAEGTGSASRFFAATARDIDTAWDIVAAGDLRFPEVSGPRTLKTKVMGMYLPAYQRAAHLDPDLARRFLEVANLLMPPTALLGPSVIGRVLFRRGTP